MRIRAARSADVEALHDLRSRVAENVLSDPARVTESSYLPYLADGAAWVAETDGGIAGFAILDLQDASVWALFVAPEAEGRGIGRALHARLIEEATGRGFAGLTLRTAPGTRAERFYTEAGWTRAGTTRTGELSFEKKLAS